MSKGIFANFYGLAKIQTIIKKNHKLSNKYTN